MLRLVFLLLFCVFSNAHGYNLPQVNNAQRIIALSPHSVELLFALGVGERIVGTTEFADFPQAANKIERIGGYHGIQLERIMELKPDLIVAWQGGNSDEDLNQLESLGLPVYRSATKRLQHITTEISVLGDLTGTPEKAKQLIAEFNGVFDRLKADNVSKQKIRFFYQLWSSPIRTISTGSWISEMLEICGGVNIFDDPSIEYPQVSLESILLKAPQVIIIPSAHGHDNGEISGLKWHEWPEIPAVKHDHIYRINGDILHRFSLRVVQATEKVCETFDHVRASAH